MLPIAGCQGFVAVESCGSNYRVAHVKAMGQHQRFHQTRGYRAGALADGNDFGEKIGEGNAEELQKNPRVIDAYMGRDAASALNQAPVAA